MGRQLTANVLVLHPDTDEPEVLLEGSEVPDWAVDQVGDHVLDGDSSDSGKSEKDGVAEGVTATQSVTDSVLVKHAKRMVDLSAGVLAGKSSKPVGNPPPLQGSGSSKAKWADYAESNGVEVHDGMSRDDIVGACRSAGVPVE